MIKKVIIFTLIIICASGSYFFLAAKKKENLRVALTLGGLTILPYRALLNGNYDRENLDLSFITKAMYSDLWVVYDKNNAKSILKKKYNARISGFELIQKTVEKEADLSFVDVADFLKSCATGIPVVGIAMLGADTTDRPGHAIALRNGVVIKSPKDLEKIIWGTRILSSGDHIFLKEFLANEGADPSKIKLMPIEDDLIGAFLKSGKIQGAYLDLMELLTYNPKNIAYIYRKLDWVEPAVSHGVAIVSREYLNNNRETLKKFVRAYIKRIAFEHSLPEAKRSSGVDYERDKPRFKMKFYEMDVNFKGMNLPQFNKIPNLRKSLEDKAVEMFFRHGYIDKKIDPSQCYDNSLVEEVAAEMYPGLPLTN